MGEGLMRARAAARATQKPRSQLSRGDQLILEKRDNRELKKHLRDLTDAVKVCLQALDDEMVRPPSEARGSRIAKISNALNLQNDIARRFGLGER